MNAPTPDSSLAGMIAAFCRDGFEPPTSRVREELPSSEQWRAVQLAGTELWLDTGDIDAIRTLWTREFTALTTNNTLLNKEVQKGLYDRLVPEAAELVLGAEPSMPKPQVVLEIAFMLNAIHGLKLVQQFDADVSVELHTALAHDAEASYRYGKRFAAIEPQRFIVKVPLTPDGLIAARRLSDDGVRVNFTLGFSARENVLIARLARPSWVNVFMGRLNSFVQSNALGDGENIGEKATLASQRAMRDPRHGEVRQIGASIRSGAQVQALCGVDVLTIPTGAAQEFLDAKPDPATVSDRTDEDPHIELAPGAEGAKLDVLWEVDDAVCAAADELAASDPSSWTADRIRSTLREHGAGGIFPDLTPGESARIAADGKIPVASAWRRAIDTDTASWDGLMTLAGLASFAADQQKLDDRIQSSL